MANFQRAPFVPSLKIAKNLSFSSSGHSQQQSQVRPAGVVGTIGALPLAPRGVYVYPFPMSGVLAQLPEVFDQEAFNLQRWGELESDPFLASLDHRIETDQFGRIIMMPPPGFQHSDLQGLILEKLRDLMLGSEGRCRPECPVSTSGGVKSVDVVWVSHQRVAEGLRQNVLTIAPEICVEVLSPGNTRAEIEEKKRLYFEAGAEEVWIASPAGEIAFFQADGEREDSALCPGFPGKLDL
jgi:Uma2 family endonuclease